MPSESLTIGSILLRIALSMLLSGILGFEREKKRRPAGFRTYIVVCLGSSLAMMTGIYLTDLYGTGDPGRIAAQVISGIGFLGAGTILVTRQNQVKGLTTAAGLWASACLGLALGAGFYIGAVLSFIGIWSSLKILQKVDSYLYLHSKVINLYVEFASVSDVSHFIAYARSQNCSVRNLEMNRSKNADGSVSISAVMSLKFEEPISHAQIVEIYGALDGITFLEEV